MRELESLREFAHLLESRRGRLSKAAPDSILFSYQCPCFPREVLAAAGVDSVSLGWLAGIFGSRSSRLGSRCGQVGRFCAECCCCPKVSPWDVVPKISYFIGVAVCPQAMGRLEALQADGYVHIMGLPHPVLVTNSRDSSVRQIAFLKTFVESIVGRKISTDDIAAAAECENRIRAQITRISELRVSGVAPIKGSQSKFVSGLRYVLQADCYLRALEGLVDELEQRKADGVDVYQEKAPRLLIIGSSTNAPHGLGAEGARDPLRFIEEAGGAPVSEIICSAGSFDTDQIRRTGDDWLRALAAHRGNTRSGACQMGNEGRIYQCISAATGARVDGVIYLQSSPCDVFLPEIERLADVFRRLGIPLLAAPVWGSRRQLDEAKSGISSFVTALRRRTHVSLDARLEFRLQESSPDTLSP